MAKTDDLGVPRVDEAVDLDTVRDEAEEIAVPAFDYIAQPIAGIVEGLTGHAHDFERDHEDTQVEPEPSEHTSRSVEESANIYDER
ncbi:hypothetical protein [Dactylosporangium sp. CA-139066]|uniref:hypothetical protein n=1 Tax=Dactylosporangium sp. CA-139066 TaxID=3239930 RepID=UPI003D925F91